MGFLKPGRGTIELNGVDLTDGRRTEIARLV